MTKLALIAVLLFPLSSFAEVECTALSRSVDGKRKESMPLLLEGGSTEFVKWNAEIGLAYFSVSHDKQEDDYLLMITRGTKAEGSTEVVYENGASIRGVPNKQGKLRASLVTPTDVYQILCVQK